ncbi:MAG: hypothetical protein NTW75_02645 [Planctomycetales bacterium]|nr:hypothetical protein [Planctomycetales bacterium]
MLIIREFPAIHSLYAVEQRLIYRVRRALLLRVDISNRQRQRDGSETKV